MKTLASLLVILLSALPMHSQLIPSSDEFNRACSIQDWKMVNIEECWNADHTEVRDIDVSNEGVLTIMPWTTAWYENYRSNLLYKEVSGNFAYTIHVSATNKEATDVPGGSFSLAGAMVRAPLEASDCNTGWVSGQEDYVFLSLGRASGSAAPHFEVKTTTNGASSLNITPISNAEAIIRLLRINNAVIALHQVTGESWQIRARFNRGDLPDTLMVGNVAYTDWNKVNDYTPAFQNRNVINAQLDPDPASSQDTFMPDIIASFEYSRFESLEIPVDLVGLDFSNPAEVSDSAIIANYTYQSVSQDLEGWKIWKGKTASWSDAENWSDSIAPISTDSIIIPNCNCDDVLFPEINTGSHSFSSMLIESGGQLTIQNGASLEVDLIGTNAQFNNNGTIDNNGILLISNMLGKSVENTGEINNLGSGTASFVDN